jgi:Tfp pilus assembly protein PilW
VYLLAWSRAKGRPVLKTIDPGFYFPVLTDGSLDADDYPQRVHLAWETPADPSTGRKGTLRRVTYELGPIGEDSEDSTTTRRYGWSTQPSAVTCYLTDAEWDLDQVDKAGDIDALSLSRPLPNERRRRSA